MTPQEGKKRLMKLLGKHGGWRDSGGMTSPEGRAEHKEAAVTTKATYDDLKARRDALHRKLLENPEYQALVKEAADARKAWERHQAYSAHYRLTAGTTESGMFFMVKAHGDNWSDLIKRLEERSGRIDDFRAGRKSGAA
jgi:hypothetical protein